MYRSAAPSLAWIPAILLGGLVIVGCGDDALEGVLDNILSRTGFEKVNVANATNRTVSGTLTVTGPDGVNVLTEAFQLGPSENGLQFNLSVEDDSAFASYDAVFSASGRYDVSVTLDEQIGGVDTRETSVEMTSPTEQRLLVALVPDQEPTIQIIRIPTPEEKSET